MKFHKDANFWQQIVMKLYEQKENGFLCDVRFVNGNASVYAHSCILVSCSPLLHRIFTNLYNANNKSNNICSGNKTFDIKLSYVTKSNESSDMNCLKCVSNIIDFIYTGQVEVDEQHKVHFINIAHNLEIKSLQQFIGDDKCNYSVSQDVKINRSEKQEPELNSFVCTDGQVGVDFRDVQLASNINKNIYREELGQKKLEASRINSKKPMKSLDSNRSYLTSTRFRKQTVKHNSHECEECGFIAPYRSILRRHALKHKKSLPCSYGGCTVVTSTEFNLKQHMYTHSLQKQFVCEECSMKFSHEKNLLRHQRTLHNTKRDQYKCVCCKYTTPRTDKLKEHCKVVHSGSSEALNSLNKLLELKKINNLETKRKAAINTPQRIKMKECDRKYELSEETDKIENNDSLSSARAKTDSSQDLTRGGINAKTTYILSETTGEFSIISENEGERIPVASVTSTNVLTIGNFREGTGSVTLNEDTGVLTLNNINSESTGAVFLNESTGEFSFINLTQDIEAKVGDEVPPNSDEPTIQLNEFTGEMCTVLSDKTHPNKTDDDSMFDTFDVDFINDESCDGFDDLDNLLFDPDPFDLLINGNEKDSFPGMPHLNEATGELSFEANVDSENSDHVWNSEPTFPEIVDEQIDDSYSLLLNEFTGEFT